MKDDSARAKPPSGAAGLETIRVALPASLVAAAREAVARHSAEQTGGSLDALVAESLRRYLRAIGYEPAAQSSDGSGHTPDGWYD